MIIQLVISILDNIDIINHSNILSEDKNIVKDLTKFTIKEYTFISRFFYPYYLPFYKYDPSRTNYKLYNGFRDYKQEILTK